MSGHDTRGDGRRSGRFTLPPPFSLAVARRLPGAPAPKRVLVAVVALSLAVAPVGPVVALGGSSSAAGPVELDSCTTIDAPGTYVLTADVRNSSADSCVRIRSSDVRFDGNGHVLDGVDAGDSVGVDLAPPGGDGTLENVTVANATLTDWGDGVLVHGPDWGGRVSDVVIRDNAVASSVDDGIALRGFRLDDLSNASVVDNRVSDNRNGIVLRNFGRNFSVAGNAVTGNDRTGIFVFEGGSDVTIRDNAVSNSGNSGVFVSNDVDAPTVVDNEVTANDGHGITVGISSDVVVADNRVASNGEHGLTVSDTQGATVEGNTLASNGRDGLRVTSASGFRIAGNEIVDNGANGVTLDLGSEPRLVDNAVRANANWAVHADSGAVVEVENLTLDSARISFRGRNVALAPVSDPPPDPEGMTSVGQYVNATDTSRDAWLVLNVSYAEADLAAAGASEESLSMWRYDGTWTRLPGRNGVDADANVVYANVTAFGVVAPLGTESTPNEPPVARFDHDPPTPTVGERVRFDASASSDPEDGSIGFEWDLDGDGEFEAEGVRVPHAFETPGRRDVAVRVTDDEGATTVTTRTVNVEPPTDETTAGVDVNGDGTRSRDGSPAGDDRHQDVDGDGDVDVLDVQVLFRDLIGDGDAAGQSAFDFDGDGDVDILDVQTLFASTR